MARKQQLAEAAGETEPLRAANKQLRTSLASAMETIELLEARLKEEGEGPNTPEHNRRLSINTNTRTSGRGGGQSEVGDGSGGNSVSLGSNPTAGSTRTGVQCCSMHTR